jgi:RimJ/RimL family protein N-acetyltransferase
MGPADHTPATAALRSRSGAGRSPNVKPIAPFPTLTTERFTLSPLRVEDAVAMATVLNDPSMYEFTGGSPPTESQLRDRYHHLAVGWSPDRSERWCNWVVRTHADPQALGAVQATVWANRAQVAWEVGPPWQGRGVATEAAGAVLVWLLTEGVTVVEATIHPEHAASQRVAERIGLRATLEEDDGEVVWRLPRA